MDSVRHEQFARAFIQHQGSIYGYIVTMLPNRHDAEDVFQQTCLILWQKWDQFDPNRGFLPWACGIARNEIRNFRHHRDRDQVALSDTLLDALAEARLESQPLLEERRGLLAECMKRLEFVARELLERCYAGREPIPVIARQFRTTPNAVYLRLRRIRRDLMECIEQNANREESP
jgi:RNA polymerase sigma-70 factor, ECF subfamily